MKLEESFAVTHPPERVFAFFADVERVAGCVPSKVREVSDAFAAA